MILGGGFGGLNAARKLGNRKDVEVVLIDRTNHHLFQPLLYQVATAGLNPAEIAVPIRSVLKKYRNIRVVMDEVANLDLHSRKVICTTGEYSYDYLIVALGGENNYYGHDQWAQFTVPLKSLVEALNIRERILCALEMAEREHDPVMKKTLLSVVVIGGGPTGVEVAGALAELRKSVLEKEFHNIHLEDFRIILVEGAASLLHGFHPTLREYAHGHLRQMGVTVLLNSPVQDIRQNCVVTDTLTIKASTIIWAAGIQGNHLLRETGIATDHSGRAMVDPYYRLPDFPEVYVIGDLAHYEFEHTYKGRMLPAVSPVAIQGGKFVAGDILNRVRHASSRPFRYLYKGMMSTIGRSAAVVEFPFLRMKGFPAWLVWVFVHVMYLVDFQNRVIVFMRWVWYYLAWKKGSRLITRILSLDISRKECSDQPTEV